ncbi:MAG TPA: hypothetical protein VNS79_03245 [Sphingobium sp.]|nr:hypothetical protein [Sphingobium sp.]
MTPPLRFRIHVTEPFGFERANGGAADLFGTTPDSADADATEWTVALESWFHLDDEDHDVVLVAPRYVGEPLARVFDSLLGFPVRIAHRVPDGWRFAMTGMLSLAPLANDDDESPGQKDRI